MDIVAGLSADQTSEERLASSASGGILRLLSPEDLVAEPLVVSLVSMDLMDLAFDSSLERRSVISGLIVGDLESGLMILVES